MPNQRKKSKVPLSGWYEENLVDDLRAMAKARGMSMSALVEEILEAEVAAHGPSGELKMIPDPTKIRYPDRKQSDAARVISLNESSSSSEDNDRKAFALIKKAARKSKGSSSADASHPGDKP